MILTYYKNYKLKLLVILSILLIILISCTGPYSVPKKDKNEKSSRVIFDDEIDHFSSKNHKPGDDGKYRS